MPDAARVIFVHTVCTAIVAGQRALCGTIGRVPHSPVHAFHRQIHRLCTSVHISSTGLSTGVHESALTVLARRT